MKASSKKEYKMIETGQKKKKKLGKKKLRQLHQYKHRP